MPRTDIVRIQMPGPYTDTPAVVTYSATDVPNGNRMKWTGKEILLVRNTDASVSRAFSLLSTPDRSGRNGQVDKTMLAGDFDVYGPFTDPQGWVQSDGYIYITGALNIVFAVLLLP
jgi:hypothetical protein